jgi:hypothetical protein
MDAGAFAYRRGQGWRGVDKPGKVAPVSSTKYLPTVPAIVRESLLILVATVGAAWVISKVPAWQRLVRGSSIPSPFDP